MNVAATSDRGVLYASFGHDGRPPPPPSPRDLPLLPVVWCWPRGTASGSSRPPPAHASTGAAWSPGWRSQSRCRPPASSPSSAPPDLSPRRLSLVDTSEQATAATTAEIGFASSVLGVRANCTRLAVVLEVRVHVFDLARLEAPFATIDTAANPRGLCALSDSSCTGLCYLATPAGLHSGSVLIHDALEAQALCQVDAHHSPVAAMAFSRDGSLLATASTTGTLVYVFSMPQAAKV
eukprot:SM000034S12771  [mRNA]  locus=s34:679797:681524:- [translate_table: standard]